MPLTEMLSSLYSIQSEGKRTIDNREGYTKGEYIYFTISGKNRETILMEQATLAYHLKENGVANVAYPIANSNGDWFTSYGDDNWMVLELDMNSIRNTKVPGLQLGSIHQIGASFQYEPKTISSYGKWKELWIEKLTFFEEEIEKQAKEVRGDYYRELMDILPYIVGVSENAIQYLQESEKEQRILETDQGTCCFVRWNPQGNQVLWTDGFVFDHPTRDIAEYIRWCFVNQRDKDNMIRFLHDYQSYQPLSIFGWRIIYARLLFPIHLYDLLEEGFTSRDTSMLIQMQTIQESYEKQLREFFQIVGVNTSDWQIPVVNWL
ncbi:hypothetical protein [Oceanobacillus sp. 1P07AA]|uniref:hypothetical protein n=1 Tax=Oceanobacillus sp. 1P07AA TaxID=3132293 RepID=UPI0039A62C29